MPQQGLWPCPGPLAGKQAPGDGGVRAQAASGTCPCAAAGSGLQWGPGCLGWPAGSLANGAARGWAGVCGAEPGWFPAWARVGSGSSWLSSVFAASYLIGPCWLAAIFSLQVCEGGVALSPPWLPSSTSKPWEKPADTRPFLLLHCSIQHPFSQPDPTEMREQSIHLWPDTAHWSPGPSEPQFPPVKWECFSPAHLPRRMVRGWLGR